jgi:hypothetical protein
VCISLNQATNTKGLCLKSKEQHPCRDADPPDAVGVVVPSAGGRAFWHPTTAAACAPRVPSAPSQTARAIAYPDVSGDRGIDDVQILAATWHCPLPHRFIVLRLVSPVVLDSINANCTPCSARSRRARRRSVTRGPRCDPCVTPTLAPDWVSSCVRFPTLDADSSRPDGFLRETSSVPT